MAQITLQDIPERDLERYYKLVQASKKKRDSLDKYIVDYRLRDLDGTYIKHSSKTFDFDKDAKAFIRRLQNEHAVTLYKKEHPGCMMTFAEVCEEYTGAVSLMLFLKIQSAFIMVSVFLQVRQILLRLLQSRRAETTDFTQATLSMKDIWASKIMLRQAHFSEWIIFILSLTNMLTR